MARNGPPTVSRPSALPSMPPKPIEPTTKTALLDLMAELHDHYVSGRGPPSQIPRPASLMAGAPARETKRNYQRPKRRIRLQK